MESSTNTNEFRKALTFTLKWEGGYVNDPDDPGGETKWGISKRAYPNLDIKNLTDDVAANIYYTDYWIKAGCGNMPWPYSGAVFDTAVNCGVGRTVGWVKDSSDVSAFIERRKQHYIQLVNKNDRMFKYFKGWMKRLNDLKKFIEINQAI